VSLADGSRITVERDGELVAVSAPEFDPRRIYMSARLPADLGDGLYRVNYRACFADSSCAEGQIGFQVNAARVQDFVDLTAEERVTIHLKDVTYQPNLLIISPGTTVTWVNDDSFEHFVNSDPHPSHNSFPALNSLDIPPTGNFSFTFEEPGEYAFHCSAHVPQNMFGTILVRAGSEMRDIQPTAEPGAAAQSVPSAVPTATPAPPTPSPTLVPTLVPPTIVPTATASPAILKVPESDLPPQRFAAHFVRSEPEHADLLASVPSQAHIYFDFTLARSSNIEIRKDGAKLPLDGWVLSENRLRMTVNVPDAGAGMYHVLFNACWPDKSCHPGEFAFVVR
jgi:plastocyanin